MHSCKRAKISDTERTGEMRAGLGLERCGGVEGEAESDAGATGEPSVRCGMPG